MRLEKIVALLDAHFGEINHEETDNQHKLVINVDSSQVKINVESMVSILLLIHIHPPHTHSQHVECPDQALKERVQSVLAIAIMTVTPLSAVTNTSETAIDNVKVEK